jgi:hypothetical protein
MGSLVGVVTAFLAQLNGPFVIAVFTIIMVLGVIGAVLDHHASVWKFVIWVGIAGAFCAGASTFMQAVLA